MRGGGTLLKRKFTIFIGLLIIISVGFLFVAFNINTYHSTTTAGIVISKERNPYSFTLKKFAKDTESTELTKIIVHDENIWKLIEKNRSYFVNYYWRNSEAPVLGQIQINDEFGKIYGDKLNKYIR